MKLIIIVIIPKKKSTRNFGNEIGVFGVLENLKYILRLTRNITHPEFNLSGGSRGFSQK
jgi:hypothetical protein